MSDITIAGQTDVGQRRTDNQDAFIGTPIWGDSSALLVVIDGVGGYAGGDRAAAIARESIERYMATPNGDPLSMLREAVIFANNQINEQREQDPKLAQMCCVLTAVVADVRVGKLYFVHVGDTRLYRYRPAGLEKLTADHSLVGIREDARQLTEAEAMQHPRRNEILREVGSAPHRVDDPDFLDSGETDFGPGDVLLLCSDGLTDMITQAQITGILNRKLSLPEQVTGLIKRANQQGGNDNITVVLARNNTQSAQPSPPASPASATGTRPVVSPLLAPNTGGGATATTPTAQRLPIGWAVLGIVLLAGIVAGLWYQFGQSDGSVSATDSLKATSADSVAALPVARSARLDSLLQTAYRSANHRLVLPNDTIRLAQPLLLTDSLLSIVGGNLTVLMPADTTRARVALRVAGRDTVRLENLVISGFKTGIETTGPARLQLKAVYFKNVNLPVSAAVRQDTFRHALLTIAVQNQPISPKPVRN